MERSKCGESTELDRSPALCEGRIARSNTDVGGYSTTSIDSFPYSRTPSEISSLSDPPDEQPSSSETSPTGWPGAKFMAQAPTILTKLATKKYDRVLLHGKTAEDKIVSGAEMEMMKDRFSKLLLGEDMSGGGKGVCSAVAISNAITNLFATVFGQFRRLEPVPPEKKSMWRREMDWLLAVCDYIVEFAPSVQNLPDGTALEVMGSRPRTDIYINLPALQKLDAMLLEILESFRNAEFWYVEEGDCSPHASMMGSFRRVIHRNDEKWWLPVPCVPADGLPGCTSKAKGNLCRKNTLSFIPKHCGRTPFHLFRYITTTDQYSPEDLLDCVEISSEHEALEFADRVEASMHIWRRKASMHHSKSSWDLVKDFMADENKNETLANRAENLLQCLKQRYPELSQTTLDTCKIQCNKDVGQAILESYSRVLESLAFNIVARIDDVLYVDGSVKKLEA